MLFYLNIPQFNEFGVLVTAEFFKKGGTSIK
jgi:hypothetical protein